MEVSGPLRQEQNLSQDREKKLDKENNIVQKETTISPTVRRKENNVDIPPGQRLSIIVACQAM